MACVVNWLTGQKQFMAILLSDIVYKTYRTQDLTNFDLTVWKYKLFWDLGVCLGKLIKNLPPGHQTSASSCLILPCIL